MQSMARVSVAWCGLAVLFCAVAGASWLEEDPNPIRMVSNVESEVIQVIGRCRNALSFVRFVDRFGKRYRSAEEMKARFEVFSENLKFIRSANKKRLPYTLAVNRMCYTLLCSIFSCVSSFFVPV